MFFPGRNDPNKPMSKASINKVIKRIGYSWELMGHGFRHTLSTILHENGFESALIEMQLAMLIKIVYEELTIMLYTLKKEEKCFNGMQEI
jgi:integrase